MAEVVGRFIQGDYLGAMVGAGLRRLAEGQLVRLNLVREGKINTIMGYTA